MERLKIDGPAEALDLLREAVSTKGFDYVYNAGGEDPCHYFQNDAGADIPGGADPKDVKPGCIIGHVLAHNGFDPVVEPELAKVIEGQDVATLAKGHYDGAFPSLIEASPVVIEMLAQAQTAQDEGQSWGEALRVARAVARGAEVAQTTV